MSTRATTMPALIEALATRILWLDRNKHHHLSNHRLGIFRDNCVDPATLQELTELGYTISVEGFPLIFGDLRRNTDLKARVGELQRKTSVLLSMMDNRAMRKWNGYWDQPSAADMDTEDEGVTDQANRQTTFRQLTPYLRRTSKQSMEGLIVPTSTKNLNSQGTPGTITASFSNRSADHPVVVGVRRPMSCPVSKA